MGGGCGCVGGGSGCVAQTSYHIVERRVSRAAGKSRRCGLKGKPLDHIQRTRVQNDHMIPAKIR